MFRDGLAARGIEELPQQLVTAHRPGDDGRRSSPSGETLPYDLFVGIPVHRAPDPLAASGLAVNGWVPVDQTNLRTQFPGVYAIGDVCTGPRTVPKAGIFAEAAALVVADDIAADDLRARSRRRPTRGRAICYAEFGDGLVSKVEVNFLSGEAPDGRALRAVARVRRREGGVRRDSARALVRTLITRPARRRARRGLRRAARRRSTPCAARRAGCGTRRTPPSRPCRHTCARRKARPDGGPSTR